MPQSDPTTPLEIELPSHSLRAHRLGQGPRTFLCLHGLVDSARIWKRLAPGLAERGETVLLDQRGHGRSGAPPGPFEREELADDVTAVLDALELERAVLVGHSLGGIVSLTTALRHPDRVSGLILLGTASQCSEKAAAWYEKIALAGEASGLEGLAETIYGPGSDRRIEGEARAIAAVTRTLKSLHDRPLTPRLGEIQCPALVMVGDKDPMKPRASQIIAEAISESTFQTLDGVGHWIHVEAPEAVLRASDAWLPCLSPASGPDST